MIPYFSRFELHYDNTPIQYTAFFHGGKNDNFQILYFSILFQIFAKNIDRWYTLEPSQLCCIIHESHDVYGRDNVSRDLKLYHRIGHCSIS